MFIYIMYVSMYVCMYIHTIVLRTQFEPFSTVFERSTSGYAIIEIGSYICHET
jgi:hypothetical protein